MTLVFSIHLLPASLAEHAEEALRDARKGCRYVLP